jgi:hypothetical protein
MHPGRLVKPYIIATPLTAMNAMTITSIRVLP